MVERNVNRVVVVKGWGAMDYVRRGLEVPLEIHSEALKLSRKKFQDDNLPASGSPFQAPMREIQERGFK